MDDAKGQVGTRASVVPDPREDPQHPEHAAWLREVEEAVAKQRDDKRA